MKLDHSKFKIANNKEIYQMVYQNVLDFLGVIDELKVKDFNLTLFEKDLEQFFVDNISLREIEKFNL